MASFSNVSEQRVSESAVRCKLCLNDADLCKSHIIPEFCFYPFYDPSHRFIEVTDVKKGKVRKGQKGYWEKLLCQSCEAHISRFERHARRLFVDPLPSLHPGTRTVRKHVRLRYNLLKLFFLSVLWRSSVSTNSFYKFVSLGPHEETMRKMLLNDDPGSPDLYSVLPYALHFERVWLRDFMVEPTWTKFEARRCYRFVMAGFVIFIFVSSHPLHGELLRHVLSPNRTVETYDKELAAFGFLREVWNKSSETTKDVNI